MKVGGYDASKLQGRLMDPWGMRWMDWRMHLGRVPAPNALEPGQRNPGEE